jgi:hypothetical protein
MVEDECVVWVGTEEGIETKPEPKQSIPRALNVAEAAIFARAALPAPSVTLKIFCAAADAESVLYAFRMAFPPPCRMMMQLAPELRALSSSCTLDAARSWAVLERSCDDISRHKAAISLRRHRQAHP